MDNEEIKITLIEDNKTTAKILSKVFESADGFRLDNVFYSAEEALADFNEFSSDLIISDIRLSPELNGLHGARTIRELVNVPILFYSSTLNHDLIKQCLALKNSAFVSKNSSVPDLLRKINEFFPKP